MTNSISIAFLGPDGSGKSTIIHGLLNQNLPFERYDYFHLKPIPKNDNDEEKVVKDPHTLPPYSSLKSYLKLLYFVFEYNIGWFRNILILHNKSSLIIFDRYYDDLMVDSLRYRYGGSKKVAKFFRQFIPRPELYFVLTTDPDVIYKRKQEVPFAELERQIAQYRQLVDGKRYFGIDVNRTPDEIIAGISEILNYRIGEGH